MVCAREVSERDLILYINFDNATVRPEVNRAEAEVLPDPKGRFKFPSGIRGRGFLTGEGNQTVTYKLNRARDLQKEGTLIFWMKPINWEMYDRETTERFIHFWGEGGYGMIYSWIYNPVWLWTEKAGTTERRVLQFPYKEYWNPGWNMLSLTWRGSACYSYFNGQPVEKNDSFGAVFFGSQWRIGASAAQKYKFILDEFSLYNRALSDSEIAQIYRGVASIASDPFISIPQATQSVSIDGEINEEEWVDAAAITGLVDERGIPVETPGIFYLKYDEANLYIAYYGEIPQRVKNRLHEEALHGFVRQEATARDGNVEEDDAVEILIRPDRLKGNYLRLLTNNLGTHCDSIVRESGAVSSEWNPAWKSKGRAGLDGWRMEIAIPWGSLPGIAGKPGETFGLNLKRIWRRLEKRTDLWAWGMYLASEDIFLPSEDLSIGKAVLGSPGDVVIRLKEARGLEEPRAQIASSLLNPGKKERKVKALVETDSGDIRSEKEIVLPAGGKEEFNFSEAISSPSASLLAIVFTDITEKKSRELMALRIPFRQEEKLDIYLRHYPAYDLAILEMNLGLFRSEPLSTLRARLIVKDASGKKVKEMRRLKFKNYFPKVKLELGDLKAGNYTIEVTLFTRSRPLSKKSLPLEKRELPEWYGNKIGIGDRVPPPFDPLKVEGTTVSCWGRRYTFGESLFPEHITSQSDAILAEPIVLSVKSGGEEFKTGGSPIHFTSKKESRVEWEGKQNLGPLDAEVSGWIDYDGFTWMKVRLLPEKAAKVDAVELHIPWTASYSTLVNNYDYGLRTTGAAPKEPWERKSQPLWLGNEKGGMQWLTQTTLPWKIKGKPIKVIPEENKTTVIIRFVDAPIVLKEPLEVSFGLIATPVRPRTIGYWDEFKGTAKVRWGYGNFQPADKEWGNPFAWPEWAYGVSHPKGKKPVHSGPYVMFENMRVGPTEIGKKAEEVLKYWYHEWVANAEARWTPGPKSVKIAPSSKSWQDFFVWIYKGLYDRHRYTGFYYDVSMPNMSNNLYAGAGYEMPDGSVKATWTLLGARAIAKRLYQMLRWMEPEGSIRYHMSGQINCALVGFCEMIVDGENWVSRLSYAKPFNWQHTNLPMFRAEYMGHNFGPVTWWLVQNTRALPKARGEGWKKIYGSGPEEVEYIVGLVLLHNSALWAAYFPLEFMKPTQEALKAYDMNNINYDFSGYWEQGYIKADPTLPISVYREKKGKRALFVLFNQEEFKGPVTLAVDWNALGVDASTVLVEDLAHGGKAQLSDGRILTEITPHNFRLIGVRPR